jgi:formylglycine-generating enzyme required for sulfatase activity
MDDIGVLRSVQGVQATAAPAVRSGRKTTDGVLLHTFNKEHFMKRLSLLSTALLAVVFALPVHAGGKKHPAAPQESASSSHGLNPAMVKIPAGSFMMGSNQGYADEQPVHRVSIDDAFEMGKTEVTQGLWKAVMGNNPSNFKACGDNCPVESVNWEDAQAFISELNAQTGKHYRLPTEAEWEYACRAGTDSEYCGNSVAGVAWYEANSDKQTHPVATKRANAWGLYDMSGNVWELVEDKYHEAGYGGAPTDGSAWIAGGECSRILVNSGFHGCRVLRGGSWVNGSQDLRAANRGSLDPSSRYRINGFRLARTLP